MDALDLRKGPRHIPHPSRSGCAACGLTAYEMANVGGGHPERCGPKYAGTVVMVDHTTGVVKALLPSAKEWVTR